MCLTSGLDEKFDGYFQGYLAGLTLLKDKTESDRVIKCLNNCQENLDFHALSEMHSGTVSKPSMPYHIEPRHKKTCLRGLQPGQIQIGLLSYRDYLEA